jgi:hypothetical protein
VRAKTVIATTAVLAAAAAAVIAFLPFRSTPKNAALAARQEAMEKLGACIAKLRPGCKVLVLSNPFTKDSGFLEPKAQFERAGVRGLRDGLGEKASVTVVFPEISAEFRADPQSVFIPPDSRTPLSFLVPSASVEQLADAHAECSIIVSLIGLPAGMDQTKLWNEKDPRCFALLLPDLRVLGPPEQAAEAFRRGKILAAVADDTLRPGNHLVITSDNIQEVLQRQPATLGY